MADGEGDDNNGIRSTSTRSSDVRVKRRRATAAGDIVEDDVYGEPPKRVSPKSDTQVADVNVLDAWRDRMGKVADDVIATEAGVSRAMVGGYRRRYGIEAYQGYKWQKGVGPPRRGKPGGRKRSSGTSADTAVPTRRRKGKSNVLQDYVSDLGRVPDEVIAERAGLSRGVVGRFRRERGIAAYDGYKFQDGHAPLGGVASAAPAKRRGRPPGKAAAKDRAANKPGARSGAPRGPRGRLSDFAEFIGTVPDAEIAAMANVSRPSVATWRHRRGIAPAPRASGIGGATVPTAGTEAAPRRRGRPPGSRNKATVAAEAAAAVAATSAGARFVSARGGSVAYAVIVTHGRQRSEYVALGATLVEAAQRVAAVLAGRKGGPFVIEELRVLGVAI